MPNKKPNIRFGGNENEEALTLDPCSSNGADCLRKKTPRMIHLIVQIQPQPRSDLRRSFV